MSEWKESTLGEIAGVQTGPFGSQLHRKDYKLVGTPIITVEHLGDNRITRQNLPLVGDDDKERLSKYLIFEGDIVFSRVGSVDRRAYVSNQEDGWMFSGRLLRVRVNKNVIGSKFLSYYFGQSNFKEHIRRIAVGATMPSINTKILKGVEISYPPLPEQKAI
ncbi:MAG: restriction endonuclease subunit S, partial [Anaerolineae bacterium]|nr:restriction endonuclease subunit S [Anaerolineae bacterium]